MWQNFLFLSRYEFLTVHSPPSQCYLNVPRFPLDAPPAARNDVAPPALAHLATAAASVVVVVVDAVEMGVAAHGAVNVTCVFKSVIEIQARAKHCRCFAKHQPTVVEQEFHTT